ncbi:MAG TPA: hypothetical protein VFG68_22270, partial [Fimbriiglobus sp.]|nr:hypothetical protein [Fimbriiglobus sp.]
VAATVIALGVGVAGGFVAGRSQASAVSLRQAAEAAERARVAEDQFQTTASSARAAKTALEQLQKNYQVIDDERQAALRERDKLQEAAKHAQDKVKTLTKSDKTGPTQVSREEKNRRIIRGEEDGMVVETDKQGVVIAKGKYIGGKKEGLWYEPGKSSKDGPFSEIGEYREGKRHGVWIVVRLGEKQAELSLDWDSGEMHGYHVCYSKNKATMIHQVKYGKIRGYEWMLPYPDNPEGSWRINTAGSPSTDPHGRGEPPSEMKAILLEQIDRHTRAIQRYTAIIESDWK